MKLKKFENNLVLNKETIANLDFNQMNGIHAGNVHYDSKVATDCKTDPCGTCGTCADCS